MKIEKRFLRRDEVKIKLTEKQIEYLLDIGEDGLEEWAKSDLAEEFPGQPIARVNLVRERIAENNLDLDELTEPEKRILKDCIEGCVLHCQYQGGCWEHSFNCNCYATVIKTGKSIAKKLEKHLGPIDVPTN